MIYLSYFVIIFTIVQLLVALSNFIYIQKLSGKNFDFEGLVSVLIPARNEAYNIANILSDLQNQLFSNIEIIVFDDQSTDQTAAIVSDFCKNDQRIKLIQSDGLPTGWMGKNNACHKLSELAKGDYLLFLDADVRIKNDIVIRSVEHSVKHKLGLLSIFPKQQLKTIGEWLTVPNMNSILLTLLPLILVRKSKNPALSAANGQFMLFDKKQYQQLRPHETMKASMVEDIEIARFYKKNGISIACIAGDSFVQCRMYKGFYDAVNGFSKNVVLFFGNSFLLAFLYWMVGASGLFLVYFNLSSEYFVLCFATILSTKLFVSLVSRQNVFINSILFYPQQLVLGLFIYKALVNKITGQYRWKGRNISKI